MRVFIIALIFVGMIGVSQRVYAAEYDEVHKCDEYAAHPSDPNRWAKGVPDDEIVPGPAIKHCREAVYDYDDTPRFVFQLGRALWAGQKLEEGTKLFLELEEKSEYGPVYAYLGDAYMYGIGGVEEDQELAVSLYQIADEAGFSPAGEVLAGLGSTVENALADSSANTEVNTTSREPQTAVNVVPQDFQQQPTTQEVPFNKASYLEPAVMSGLFNGDMSSVNLGRPKYLEVDKVFFYFAGFLKPLQENYNFRDADCVYLSNPTLVRIVNTKVVQGMPGVGGMLAGNGRSLEQNLNAGGKMGWEMLGDMLKGINRGEGVLGSDIGRTGVETTLLTQNGEKDSTRMIAQHGCGSEAAKRIFTNLVYYVTGEGNLVVSAEEKQRQETIKQEKIARQEKQRQEQLRVSATNSCVSQFKKESYCRCLIVGLDEEKITEQEWKKLGTNFKEIVPVAKTYSNFAEKFKACRVTKG